MGKHYLMSIILGLALFLIHDNALSQNRFQSPELLKKYIMNPSFVEENQEPAAVPLVVFDREFDALRDDRNISNWFYSLDGQWNFRWDKNPYEVPADFYKPDFDTTEWDEITVPGTWQMQGYGYSLYRNIPLEFTPYDPPNVPLDFNPVGSYTRIFTLPEIWNDRKIFLNFDGVKTAFWIWINGEYVGFNKGAMTSAIFDVTKYLSSGENHIAVKVIRWADSTYLENQDMWKFHGIYRSVYLYATPELHIRDLFIRTDFDDTYTNATLNIDTDIINYGEVDIGSLEVVAELYDDNDQMVSSFSGKTGSLRAGSSVAVQLSQMIDEPRQWSAEKPHLYTLLMKLNGSDGETMEIIQQKVGFRQLDIMDGVLHVNGVPVKIKGVNRHEHSPYKGRTMDHSFVEEELKLMKRLNINAIRTAHYPHSPELYHLADRYGFYLVDEVNVECHQGENWLPNIAGWEASFLDRMEKFVQRDKNHPSVIIWSTGNECGLGPVHQKMADLAREIDPTRFIMHQSNQPNGDAPFADILGTRYPHPALLEAIGDTTSRSVIMGEYSHAMGNALGHFDEYWEAIYKNPRLQGGFIWDWMDQGVLFDLAEVTDRSEHKHQAVLMGRPAIVETEMGSAIGFSGLDDFIEITPSKKLDIRGPFTVELWIYPRGFVNHNNIIGKGTAIDLAQVSEREIEFTLRTSGTYRLRAELPINWNFNWHHLAARYDGEEMMIFINGEPVASTAASGNVQRVRNPITVGKNHMINNEAWEGYISNSMVTDVRIHGNARESGSLGYYQSDASIDENLMLWLTFDEVESKGTFYSYGSTPLSGSGSMNGIIAFDRIPEPEAWQVKRSHAPVYYKAIDLRTRLIEIQNRHHFTSLDEFETIWMIKQNGEVIEEGTLDLNIPPLEKQAVNIPFDLESIRDDHYTDLFISTRLKESTAWVEAGHEIAFGEFHLSPKEIITPYFWEEISGQSEELSIREDDNRISVAGSDFEYIFDLENGSLKSMNLGGQELIRDGAILNVSRVPIMNEVSTWGVPEFDLVYEWGLDSLVHELQGYSIYEVSSDQIIVQLDVNSYSGVVRDMRFVNRFAYTIHGNGMIELEHSVNPNLEYSGWPPSHIPWLQKLGLQFTLSGEMETIEWFGKGPFETYPDRKTGAKMGLYSIDIDEIEIPYIIPQDFDNRTDVRWARISTGDEIGLAIYSSHLMNVAIDPYTNLDSSWYPYQLQRSDNPVLSIDHRVTGVGGTPVTAREPYRTYPSDYTYTIYFMPYRK